jgi:hypothetical protein
MGASVRAPFLLKNGLTGFKRIAFHPGGHLRDLGVKPVLPVKIKLFSV